MNAHDYTQLLLSHVMQNKAEEAISIIENCLYDESILSDVGGCRNPLPLYKISMCQMILLSDNNWSERFLPIVQYNKINCEKLLEFWKTKFNYPVGDELDFTLYEEECGHFKDFDMDELFDGTMDDLVKMGYNQNEVELCYAVLVYDSKLLEKQMQLNTNPNVFISANIPVGHGDVQDGDSYNALISCNTFYCDAFDCYGLGLYWEADKEILNVKTRDIHLLLEASSYFQLEHSLSQLTKDVQI